MATLQFSFLMMLRVDGFAENYSLDNLGLAHPHVVDVEGDTFVGHDGDAGLGD